MSQPVPPKLNDVKFFVIVLPIPVALYLGVLWAFGAPFEITQAYLCPFDDGEVYIQLGVLSYNRWLDIIFGPVLAYIITLLWRHTYDDSKLDEWKFIFLVSGSFGTVVAAITFLLQGALGAAIVGGVWMVSCLLFIFTLILIFKIYRHCKKKLDPWLHC